MNWKCLKTRLTAVLVLWCGVAFAAHADQVKCFVCARTIEGEYVTREDYAIGGAKAICKECADLAEVCFACGLPVKTDYQTLPDGRFLCARDAREVVASDEEARQICESVHTEIDRQFSRFLVLPETNVVLSIVDVAYLKQIFKSPGYEKSCVTIFGATQTRTETNGSRIHSIAMLSHLRKSRLMAVCAHEYAHAWIGENVNAARRAGLDADTLEGFCELMAYKYMQSRGEPVETQFIKNSPYTKGQIAVLLEADSRFGINAVLEWMKAGEDVRVEMAGLDRVRLVQSVERRTVATPELPEVRPVAPTPVPDTLVLKGISGTAQRRFALINNATFQAMDRARVRVGQTNVSVRCLEIRDQSVIIQLSGSNEKLELFLRDGR